MTLRERFLTIAFVLQRHSRLLLALIASGIWSLLLLLSFILGLFETLDESFSTWAQTKPPVHEIQAPQMALIAIDRIPTDRPWPWPRLDFALAVRALIPCFPQSVVFECLLHDRDQRQESFDTTFAHLLERLNQTLFASAAFQAGSENPPPQNLLSIPFTGNIETLPPYHSLYWPLETFAANSHVGISNIPLSKSGKVTEIPLVFRWRNQLVPSLALQAAALQLKADLSKSIVHLGNSIQLRDSSQKIIRTVPIDSQGNMKLRHRSLQVLTIPFDDFLVYSDQRERGETPSVDLRQLRQRQVWIGRTDEVVQNHSSSQPPVSLQMLATQNIVQADFIKTPPFAWIALLFLSFAGCISGVITFIRLPLAIPLALGVSFLYIAMSILLLQNHNFLLPIPAFMLLTVGSILSGLAARYWDFQETFSFTQESS